MDNNDRQLTTPAFDLFAPADRFASSSRLHGRLERYQLLLRKYWWVIGLILVSIMGLAFSYTAVTPSTYKSKARMWITGKLNINEGRLYTEELIDYLATQVELLQSKTVQKRAMRRLLSQPPEGFSATLFTEQKPGALRKIKTFVKKVAGMETTISAPEDSLPFTVKVSGSSKSSIIELQATGPDPAATRAFLNCLMEEYLAFKRETEEKTANRTRTSVGSEAHQLAEALKAQREKLYEFQSSNNVVFLQEQGNGAASYLASLNRQIAGLRTQLQLLERLDPEKWIEVESRRGGGNSGEAAEAGATAVLDRVAGPQAELFRARQQAQLLRAKRDELSHSLRPEHPKMIKLGEEIATQQRLMDISRDEALRQLTNHRQALSLQLTNLEQSFQEWDRKAIASSRMTADYDAMRLDLQRLQTADDRLSAIIQTVNVSRAVNQDNIGVLEPATAGKRVPRMIINLFVALVAALGLSFTFFYGLVMFDDRFASPGEMSGYLSEQVLGQIPALPNRNLSNEAGIPFFEQQRFEFLESFRNIRATLLFMHNGSPGPKTILVTSSVPREGKSTVTLYLAATMAMANSRVLLIDADMRRPSLHKLLSVPSGPGLADVLDEKVSAASAIIPAKVKNLFVLPAGMARRNPGELVLSPEWPRLMKELYPQFDYIFIDSPPLLATEDAACLAPKVDGTMMIVRSSVTSARMARRSLELLKSRHARTLGLIFNGALLSGNGYQYYGHYREEYGWSSPRSSDQTASAE